MERRNDRTMERGNKQLNFPEIFGTKLSEQYYFNRLWGKGVKTVSQSLMTEVKQDIFTEKERDFIELRNLLPDNQMKLLIAIAKENKVEKPTANNFLTKHHLAPLQQSTQPLKCWSKKKSSITSKTPGNYTMFT